MLDWILDLVVISARLIKTCYSMRPLMQRTWISRGMFVGVGRARLYRNKIACKAGLMRQGVVKSLWDTTVSTIWYYKEGQGRRIETPAWLCIFIDYLTTST